MLLISPGREIEQKLKLQQNCLYLSKCSINCINLTWKPFVSDRQIHLGLDYDTKYDFWQIDKSDLIFLDQIRSNQSENTALQLKNLKATME